MHATANRLLVAIFLGAIGLPLAATLAGVDGADPRAENRELAAFPTPDRTWASLAQVPGGFARWFDDHFAFRSRLVQWDAALRLFVLESSPSRFVIRGRDAWLFYADDGSVEDMASAPPMPPGQIDNWREALGRARNWLHAQGIAFVFTIAPDKHAMYAEHLPPSVRRIAPASRTDQLFEALEGLQLALDLRPALLEAKARDRIYHRTDTHWNERGVFAAYQEIIAAVRRQNPSVPPAWPSADFEPVVRTSDAGDLAAMLGLKRVLREEYLLLKPKHPRQARVVEPRGAQPTDEEGRLVTRIPGSDLPRALIFRDSFVSPLVPFLSEHFSRAVYLWQNDVVAEQVLEEAPDVVIYEMVGRRLYTFIPSPGLIPK